MNKTDKKVKEYLDRAFKVYKEIYYTDAPSCAGVKKTYREDAVNIEIAKMIQLEELNELCDVVNVPEPLDQVNLCIDCTKMLCTYRGPTPVFKCADYEVSE